jgi:hypothetical protein
MNCKHLGWWAKKAAIKQGQIAMEQNSRENQKSSDYALNHKLVMGHLMYMRQPYA